MSDINIASAGVPDVPGVFDIFFKESPAEVVKREDLQAAINTQRAILGHKIDEKLKDTYAVYDFNNIHKLLDKLPLDKKGLEACQAANELADNFVEIYKPNKELQGLGDEKRNELWAQKLDNLEQSFKKVISLVKDQESIGPIKKSLLNLASLILCIVLVNAGIAYGIIVGLLKSIYELKDPFRYTFEAILGGAIIGGIVGTRLPWLLATDNNAARLNSNLSYLKYLHTNLQKEVNQDGESVSFSGEKDIRERVKKTIFRRIFVEELKKNENINKLKDEKGITCELSDADIMYDKHGIFDKYLENNEGFNKFFAEFLKKEHCIQVCSVKSSFGTKYMRGQVGQHSSIRIAVNTDKGYKYLLPIEYGPPSKNPPAFVDQAEKEIRVVSGEKLLQMLVDDRIMNPLTFDFTIPNIYYDYDKFCEYEPGGERDCHAYISRILEKHGLARAKIKRIPNDATSIFFSERTIGGTCTFNVEHLDGDHSNEVNCYTRKGLDEFKGAGSATNNEFDKKREFTGFSSKECEEAIKQHNKPR